MSGTLHAGALGVAWGTLLAAPLARAARRSASVGRAASLHPSRRRSVLPRLALVARVLAGPLRPVASLLAARSSRRTDAALARELPVVVDLLAVAVGSGATPYLALQSASRWSPPLLGARLREVQRACELGAGFADALESISRDAPRLAPLATALIASDRYGTAVGTALARLASEERATLRRAAEARARTVPVRLLFPLVFLVLPAFGLLTVVPALLDGLGRT